MKHHPESIPDRIHKYQIIEVLGKGGNGIVYRAEHPETGQAIALKTLSNLTDITLNRFKKEFFALKRMNHDLIVKVYESHFDHSPPFFTMEWIKGKTLGRVIEDMKKNPLIFSPVDRETFALELCRQLCDVLIHIHSFDEIHRDLKPENIFISPTGKNLIEDFKIKMLDFGLLKHMNAQQGVDTQQGMVVGTVQFLSPEQAKGTHLDARSDLFSVGVILYNILALDLPFHAKDLVSYLFQIVFEEPVPIREKVEDISTKMEALITRLLNKNPAKRFPSAKSLASALRTPQQPKRVVDIQAEDFSLNPFEGFGDPLLPPCLVGRDHDLEKMKTVVHSLSMKAPTILTIQAEMGLGKSFLLNEWLSKLSFERKTIFKMTFSSQYTPTQDPIGMLMDNLIRQMNQSEIQTIFKDIYPFLSSVSRYLGRFFDMQSVGSLEHLSSGRKLQLLANNFIKLIRKLSEKGPVIMVLENVHLAPERFYGWLTLFIEQMNAPQFLAVLTTREHHDNCALINFLDRVKDREPTHHIHLKPLGRKLIKALLQSMIPVNSDIPFTKELENFIATNCNGNPLFSIQLFTQLYEESNLHIQNGKLGIKQAAEIKVPHTIHQALLLKIKKMPDNALLFVESACIFGNEFELPWLQELLHWDEESFYSTLMALVKTDVFREEEEPVHKVYFQNGDLRQHIYNSLNDQRKTDLHRKAAKAIELIYNTQKEGQAAFNFDRMSLFLEQLSHHFSRCRSFVQATKYAYFSGNLALEQKNTAKAISLYKECLGFMSLSKSKNTLNLVNLKLGEVLLADHQFDEAISYFENTLNSGKKTRIEALRIYKGLTSAHRKKGNYATALEVNKKLLELSQKCSARVKADSEIEKGILLWEAFADAYAFQGAVFKALNYVPHLANYQYYSVLSSFLANNLKQTILYIKQYKKEEISPIPFLIILAFLNYMSGQFHKGLSYLDSTKKGESRFRVSPNVMIMKSLALFLIKRKAAPDHRADEYLHMADRYIDRFGLDSYKIYVHLSIMEDALFNNRLQEASEIVAKYQEGVYSLPRVNYPRKLFLFMALQVIWTQIQVPPRAWLDEFYDYRPLPNHPLNLPFHHALAMCSNAMLPLSGKAQDAIKATKQSFKTLKKYNLKYYQAVLLKKQVDLFNAIGEEDPAKSLLEKHSSLMTYL
ncbi:MAG: hypothetical protein CSA81_08350 [Acidobacteria bacterium]|nr:MAG: hypothetical protein CSA81_08350 [Acidobacteriota bacterium]PIE89735.1 MAG: hypothetical protein CR997_09885 [Acidobacteriota bacterium]